MPKLICQTDGYWVLEGTEGEDGKTDGTAIMRDDTFQTECDEPHPVRLSRERRAEWHRMSDWEKGAVRRNNFAEYCALRDGKRGYYCDGGEEHYYTQWTIRIDNEWTEEVCDSFTDARAVLESYIGKVTLQRRKRTRETVIDERTGGATWKTCGHRAEMDINEDCYTCHRSVLV